MGYPDRATVCVSSQAGCGMACPFCATGQGGLQRNLSTGEIVEQVRQAAAAARDGALGEPDPAVQRGVHGHGRAAGQLPPGGRPPSAGSPSRRRTGWASPRAASPCPPSGWCPAIDKLAAEGLPVTLAVSLHTPDDELRDTLVPVNNRWKVDEVLAAARRYAQATGPPGVDRVRADPRRQRPAVAGRPAREGAAPADRAPSGCTSTSSRSTRRRAASGTPRPAAGAGRVRAAGAGGRRGLHGARHPRPGDRRRLRPAGGVGV